MRMRTTTGGSRLVDGMYHYGFEKSGLTVHKLVKRRDGVEITPRSSNGRSTDFDPWTLWIYSYLLLFPGVCVFIPPLRSQLSGVFGRCAMNRRAAAEAARRRWAGIYLSSFKWALLWASITHILYADLRLTDRFIIMSEGAAASRCSPFLPPLLVFSLRAEAGIQIEEADREIFDFPLRSAVLYVHFVFLSRPFYLISFLLCVGLEVKKRPWCLTPFGRRRRRTGGT